MLTPVGVERRKIIFYKNYAVTYEEKITLCGSSYTSPNFLMQKAKMYVK
jgi:hypothetical protein